MRKPKIYVASPFGFSEAQRLFYETIILPLLKELGYDIIDPWKLTSQKLIDSARNLPPGKKRTEKMKTINKIVGINNERGIDDSSVMLAILDGPDVDSGTASEVGNAAGKKKTIFGYRGDFRKSGENEACIVNLQVEHFIYTSGGTIATDLKTLRKVLKKHKEGFDREWEG